MTDYTDTLTQLKQTVDTETKNLQAAFPANGSPANLDDAHKALDVATYRINKFTSDALTDPDMATAVQADGAFMAKAAAYKKLVAVDTQKYEALTKKTYVYAKPPGKEFGEDADKALTKAGTDVNKGVTSFWGSVKNFFGSIFSGGDDADEKDEKGDKKKSGLDVGNLVGGVAGGFIGWFLGNIFGGGLIGKIAGALLAIGGVFMGKQAFGNTINGWLHRPKTNEDIVNDQAKQHQLAKSVEPNPGKFEANQQEMQEILNAYHNGYGNGAPKLQTQSVKALPDSSSVNFQRQPATNGPVIQK